MMDLAFFRLPNGQAWIGEGPFAEAASPPDGAAFYVNDFTLSDAMPWKVPARLIAVKNADDINTHLNGAAPPQITWEKPATEWFKMAFRRIRKDVLSHKLRKMVPVLTETGTLTGGGMLSLLKAVFAAPDGMWSYAFAHGTNGFLGATPELLLRLEGRRLETMALAGTAKPGGTESFMTDAKEIDEHELVAGFLEETLKPLGAVMRSERSMSEAAGLTHFRTNISVELTTDNIANDLVKLLHPTPAVCSRAMKRRSRSSWSIAVSFNRLRFLVRRLASNRAMHFTVSSPFAASAGRMTKSFFQAVAVSSAAAPLIMNGASCA